MSSKPRKKQRLRSKKKRLSHEREARVREIGMMLGIWEDLSQTTLGNRLRHIYSPGVKVELGDGEEESKRKTVILRDLRKALRKATFDCPILGKRFLIRDFFSYVKPLMDIVSSVISTKASLQRRYDKTRARLELLDAIETCVDAVMELHRVFDEVLLKYGRIDECLYYMSIRYGRDANNKWFITFLLSSAEPEIRHFIKEQRRRPAYRCGQPLGPRGIEWVSWPGSVMGLKKERECPVFVQSHALENLYRREARARFIKNGEWLLHDHLWQSLREPVLTPMRGQKDKYLVEYNFWRHKLGYLVAHRVDDAILIETFLFLTMDGTPEGDALHKKLSLARRDKKALGLDKIHTFLLTDIQFDRELVHLLKECGCGHLFKILKSLPEERCFTGYAEKLRKHLGLVSSDMD